MVNEKEFPKFAMLQKVQIPMIIDYVADYPPDIYHLLDKKKLTDLFHLKIKYHQQFQKAQLAFHKQIVQIQQNYQKEVSGMLG